MGGSEQDPVFTIVIPTRNRVELFRLALDSVLAQNFASKEVVVVNDGSTGESLDGYKALEADYPGVKFVYLLHRPNGHGQSYAMNFGTSCGTGKYICFLDDDDYWTDPDHLDRAYKSMSQTAEADVYYSNQVAYFADGSLNTDNVWLDYLNDRLPADGADEQGTYTVTPEFLFSSIGFAHLNCSIFKRSFFERLNGLDENLRYENDRDIFIRTVDGAEKILFNPKVISRHHIPDTRNKSNMSTIVTANQKRLYQIYLYEKSILFAEKATTRQYCLLGKGHVLKHIAQQYAEVGDHKMAALYAGQALATGPTLKWRLYTAYLRMRALA